MKDNSSKVDRDYDNENLSYVEQSNTGQLMYAHLQLHSRRPGS
jgi:hypothetical protein